MEFCRGYLTFFFFFFLRNPQMSLTAVKTLELISFPKEELCNFLSWHGVGMEMSQPGFQSLKPIAVAVAWLWPHLMCIYLGLGSWTWILWFILYREWSPFFPWGVVPCCVGWARGPITSFLEFHRILPFSAHSSPPHEKHPPLPETSWVLQCESAHNPWSSPYIESTLLPLVCSVNHH